MPNARPTQPGYYWAKASPRWWRRNNPAWQPVELACDDEPAGTGLVFTFWAEGPLTTSDVDEWGPAIPEYRGEGGG